MMQDDKFFSVNIGRLRRDANLSQSELAEKAGVSHHTVFRAESKGIIPVRANIKKIANALGVSESYLFTEPGQSVEPDPTETPKDAILERLESIESMLKPTFSEAEVADYERLKAFEARILEYGGEDLLREIQNINEVSAEGFRISAELPPLPLTPRKHVEPLSPLPARARPAKKPVG